MKKLNRIMYQLLGSVAMFMAITSIAEVNSFCTLIIHQPDIPESLKKKVGLLEKD